MARKKYNVRANTPKKTTSKSKNSKLKDNGTPMLVTYKGLPETLKEDKNNTKPLISPAMEVTATYVRRLLRDVEKLLKWKDSVDTQLIDNKNIPIPFSESVEIKSPSQLDETLRSLYEIPVQLSDAELKQIINDLIKDKKMPTSHGYFLIRHQRDKKLVSTYYDIVTSSFAKGEIAIN